MWLAFMSGIVGILTPAAFPLIVISWFLFEKLSDSPRRHILNVLLICLGACAAALAFIFSFTSEGEPPLMVNQEVVVLFANVPLLVMAVYMLATILKVNGFDADLSKMKWLAWGISICYGVKLFLGAIVMIGPLLGSLIAAHSGEVPEHIAVMTFGGTLGFVLPICLFLGLFGMIYPQIKNGKVWMVFQSIALVWLIAISFHQINLLF